MPISADILYTVFIYKSFKQYLLYPRLTKAFSVTRFTKVNLRTEHPDMLSTYRIIDMGLLFPYLQK